MMTGGVQHFAALAGLVGLLAACEGSTGPKPRPEMAEAGTEVKRTFTYEGSTASLLGKDLYAFSVRVKGKAELADIDAYVTCVVAGYTLEKKAGFARKVRTYVKEEGSVQVADAVYSISSALPPGARTIDAETTAAECSERGIPTV